MARRLFKPVKNPDSFESILKSCEEVLEAYGLMLRVYPEVESSWGASVYQTVVYSLTLLATGEEKIIGKRMVRSGESVEALELDVVHALGLKIKGAE